MDVEAEYPCLRGDVYKFDKGRLKGVLEQFGVKWRNEDTELELRVVVKALKDALSKIKTRGDSKRLASLIKQKNYLSEEELQLNPELGFLQRFLEVRENLYDKVEKEQDLGNTVEDIYEEVRKEENERMHIQFKRANDYYYHIQQK